MVRSPSDSRPHMFGATPIYKLQKLKFEINEFSSGNSIKKIDYLSKRLNRHLYQDVFFMLIEEDDWSSRKFRNMFFRGINLSFGETVTRGLF